MLSIYIVPYVVHIYCPYILSICMAGEAQNEEKFQGYPSASKGSGQFQGAFKFKGNSEIFKFSRVHWPLCVCTISLKISVFN